MMDLLKALIIAGAYGIVGPVLGWWLARHRQAERACFCLMLFMTGWAPSKLTLMLGSIEFYRGHTKGFEFSLIEVVAVALIVCAANRRPPGFRWMPPGSWLWLSFCLLSLGSFGVALNKLYVLMAFWKFAKIILVFMAAYHGLRDLEDLRWLLRTIAAMLLVQVFVALKLRYFDGRWQVHGWFEHQNPMAMWAYLAALPLLAGALAPQTKTRETKFYLAGFMAAGLLILLSVSRGALAAFSIGSVLVIGLAALRGFSGRLLGVAAGGVVCAALAALLAMDSFAARVKEASSRVEEQDLRAVMIVQSKAMLHDSWVGIGWNNFGVANSRPLGKYSEIVEDWDKSRGFTIYDENYYANALTESLYWLLLGENGYPGFSGFVLFLLLTYWWCLRATLQYWRSLTGWVAGGLLVALTLIYIHGTVERVLTQTKNLSEWLIFAGCLARLTWCRRHGLDLAEPE